MSMFEYEKSDIVELHVYQNGFKKEYKVWTSHGKIDSFDVIQYYVPRVKVVAQWILMQKIIECRAGHKNREIETPNWTELFWYFDFDILIFGAIFGK